VKGPSASPLHTYSFNSEEINQVAVNHKGTFLAAADDSGEIKVINLQNHKLFKTLQGVHSNICSSAVFHPRRPWEVVSGGLDSKIVKWDFSRGRPLHVVDLGG
jgi:WD40 repeat protein